MNILLDFIPFQEAGGVGGAAGFTQAITNAILNYQQARHTFYAVCDSRMGVGRLIDYQAFAREHNIILQDVAKTSLATIVQQNNIDIFLIFIGQFYKNYALQNISCRTIVFIHDIFDIERNDNLIDLSIYDKNKDSLWLQAKRYINIFSKRWEKQTQQGYKNIIALCQQTTTTLYTVSNYTKNALEYYFPEIKNEIKVCCSPLREAPQTEAIENEALRQLILSGKPFLLLLAANRRYKNARNLLKVFPRLKRRFSDLHLLTLKYGSIIDAQHIDIPFLSDADLQNAYRHAHALVFPSFFEGFGYPPVEAMRYGTPTIAANVTSIPEVLANAAIYFSPFYPADIYKAAVQILENKDVLKEQLRCRYTEIIDRQNSDLARFLADVFNQ
ncbi:MAG: glycosyltransferase [Prevotella sp.]|nr:glycosyltransferase [Prevotellaceae bacterium]MDY3935537.1 glycosyltransferase [Prevotella sp.]